MFPSSPISNSLIAEKAAEVISYQITVHSNRTNKYIRLRLLDIRFISHNSKQKIKLKLILFSH